MTESVKKSSSQAKEAMEDNVLNPVAEKDRVGGWSLLANTAGVGTTLAMLLVGGTASYAIGVKWTILAAVIAATFGSVIGTLVGQVSQSTGMSSTVSTRFHGLGARGSALGSLIFAWMILSFLALENVLLYNGTLFILGWEPTTLNAIVIYSILTLMWIFLALFGLRVIQISSLWLTIIAIILLGIMLGSAISGTSDSSNVIWSQHSEDVTIESFLTALAAMIGFAGALALTGADFARYARTPKDVKIMAIGGNIIVNFGVVTAGAVLYQTGHSIIDDYLSRPGNEVIATSQAGESMDEKVQFLAQSNPGAYFIILAGILGFLVMYAAQIKAQAINAYAGSLSLSNLFDAIFRRKPSRIVMVLVGNAIAMATVYAGILGSLAQFLGALGVASFSLCALVVADFFWARKGQGVSIEKVEEWNWAGIIALTLGFVVSYGLQASGVLPIGFLLTLIITPTVYVFLRRTVLPEGSRTRMIAGTTALTEAEEVEVESSRTEAPSPVTDRV